MEGEHNPPQNRDIQSFDYLKRKRPVCDYDEDFETSCEEFGPVVRETKKTRTNPFYGDSSSKDQSPSNKYRRYKSSTGMFELENFLVFEKDYDKQSVALYKSLKSKHLDLSVYKHRLKQLEVQKYNYNKALNSYQ